VVALGFAEGVCHGAADEEGIGFFHESGDDLDFVSGFGSLPSRYSSSRSMRNPRADLETWWVTPSVEA
jgi:hypothetical protein